ncbi:MAG: ABC transporter permease [Acidimicrobiales bacterium]
MTAVTVTPVRAQARSRPATFADVVHSEWTKFKTVRSSPMTVLVTILIGVGLGALITWAISSHYHSMSFAERLTFDPVATSFDGFGLGQLAIGILGIMYISTEFSTGMISTSLAAVPRRWRVLASKSLVLTAVGLVVGEAMAFAAFFIAQIILTGNAPHATIGQPGVLRAVIGAGLYLAVVGLFGLGLGAVLRSTAGSIAVLVAVVFLLPAIANALPDSWRHPVEEYWPTQAGQQISSVTSQAYHLGPWAGFGLFCGFVAAVLGIAFLIMSRRDV